MEREFQREGLPVNPHVDLKNTFDDPWETTAWDPLEHVHLEDDPAAEMEMTEVSGELNGRRRRESAHGTPLVVPPMRPV